MQILVSTFNYYDILIRNKIKTTDKIADNIIKSVIDWGKGKRC